MNIVGHPRDDFSRFIVYAGQFGQVDNGELTVQATNDKKEIKQLLSVGFEHFCQKGDMLFFRKGK